MNTAFGTGSQAVVPPDTFASMRLGMQSERIRYQQATAETSGTSGIDRIALRTECFFRDVGQLYCAGSGRRLWLDRSGQGCRPRCDPTGLAAVGAARRPLGGDRHAHGCCRHRCRPGRGEFRKKNGTMVDGADARAVTELDASHARPTSSTSMQAGAGVRMTTLVSGVGGITGDTVLSVLAQRGVPVRALVHRDERRSAAFRLGADSVVVADYDDEAALATAIAGVDAVFFVAPRSPTLTNSPINPCCTRSLLRCPTTCGRRSPRSKSGWSRLRWTTLQPAMYGQTVLRVRERSCEGQINVPYDPDARFAVVDVHDAAACVVEELLDDAHAYGSYEIVGTEVQSLREMAATLNRILNEERQVEPGSLRLPPSCAAQQRQEYTLMCREYGTNGLQGSKSATTALLGRAPTTFADVVARDVRDSTTSGTTQ